MNNSTQETAGVVPTKHHAPKCPKLYGKECTCDGYHTFNELYAHRIAIFIALCRTLAEINPFAASHEILKATPVWRSRNHSDGEPAFGGTWFVLGLNKTAGTQITYHLPIEKWEETEFAETLDKAPEFDGHTSDDVIERLKRI